MTQVLTAEQMRNLEQSEIVSGRVSGLELMERAGRGVLRAVFANWHKLKTRSGRALVLCGPGNNGGDGFVIARLLRERGWEIDLFLFGDLARLPPDAANNAARWQEIGVVNSWSPEAILAGPRPDVIIDAVFGIGLTRPLPEAVRAVLATPVCAWARARKIRRVAVDCPSGLNLDSGCFPGSGAAATVDGEGLPRADLTVTFHCPKPGHYLAQGPAVCGLLKVVSIGLRGETRERCSIAGAPDPERARLVEGRHRGKLLPTQDWPLSRLSKAGRQGHKFEHGHAVILGGDVGRGGAARLAARGALRAGAGLVTLFCPPAALRENAARLDAIMLRPVKDAEAVAGVVDERMSAFCLGPGMGVTSRTRDFVRTVLDRRRPTVLDADALTAFAREPEAFFDLLHEDCVLTPHFGEFRTLFPDIAEAFVSGEMTPMDGMRAAAARAGAIVLLKGPTTLIAAPTGAIALHAAQYDRATPWLATAGAGDVLAGMIAGITAAGDGSGLFQDVEVAVWLHVEAARAFGPGLIAEDLPETLPAVLRTLGA